ncbi:MAG: glycosyltransferase family 4 protein [Ignisphaera sp.]
MKLLFVQPYFEFLDAFFNTLPRYLAEKGHHIEVIGYVGRRQKMNLSLKDENIHFHPIDALSLSIPYLVKEFPYFKNLEDMIKESQPDIIHINNLPFLTSFQSILIAKKLRIPSVLHVHGVIGARAKILNFMQYAFIMTLMQRAFHETNLVICLTQSDALEIQKLGCPIEKIRVIPNGVDINKFKPFREPEEDLIFWGGRFMPEKGLEHLMKALSMIVKVKPKVKLIMAGGGLFFPKIYKMVVNFGLKRNVIFKGVVAHDKLPALINTASLCVLPSLKEGMPYILLEAMACGRAVIGSDIAGINDVISHRVNGILVPPKNTKALVEAIIQLLEDRDLRRKLGENARKLIVEKYSWQKISEKVERVYYEMATSIRNKT